MKVGIMQPYFFPYLGYFSLINHSDEIILLDTVQFIRHGWIERNRILKPGDGWQYISIPLEKHSRETLIKDIRIVNGEEWTQRIIRQLEHYKKKAPNYISTIDFVRDSLNFNTDSITDLNMHLLKETCNYLSIGSKIEVFSEMKLKIEPINGPGDWALNISRSLQATEYINPIGGVEIFDRQAFNKAGIKLSFLKINLNKYNQGRGEFESGLSIIDIMMFNSPEEIRRLLNECELV